MTRKAILKETYRALFAKTGNQCCFPECRHPLIDEDNDFVTQICHIEAASSKGERYNRNMTDDERRSAENLMVMCYRHHVKTNNVETYTVDVLRKMKETHEKKWSDRPFELPDEIIDQITEGEIKFWGKFNELNENHVNKFDLARAITVPNNPIANIKKISKNIEWISTNIDDFSKFFDTLHKDISDYLTIIGYDTKILNNIKYYDNPFHNCFWECLNIGFNNTLMDTKINLKILELFLSFQQLKNTPQNIEISSQIEELKSQLLEIAQNSSYVD